MAKNARPKSPASESRALGRFSPGGLTQLARVPWPLNLIGAVLVMFQLYFAVAFIATLTGPG
ncbi:hypothetical protein [Actinocorallia sp. A-T 12471]|uniref:hypothetical protein n=1 Tax=Actinocorallia sp. A-T 12471 TaxID=3089813 RepID=UPI0029D3AFEA|nr:hypothetical protein [Actinocorallia sp. A-T 12471]MDX6738740.1 hypothetical protein [Actinocorallia sp. A-T 12471]